jgi:hypothetical protein
LNQLGKGRELFGIYEVKLVDEVDEMFEARVKVSLCREEHDMLEMCVVDVSIHSEETLENDLDDIEEIFREGDTEGTGEDFLVIKLVLDPSHQEIDILLG